MWSSDPALTTMCIHMRILVIILRELSYLANENRGHTYNKKFLPEIKVNWVFCILSGNAMS